MMKHLNSNKKGVQAHNFILAEAVEVEEVQEKATKNPQI